MADDKLMSDVITAAGGICGSVALFSLQVPLGMVSERLGRRENKFWRVIWEDGVYTVVFIALSLMWRGCWNLNVRYLLTDLPRGAWVNHVCGTVGLMGTQTFAGVAAFGMIRDCQEKDGRAFFPVRYLRSFLKSHYTRYQTPTVCMRALVLYCTYDYHHIL